MDRFCTSLDTQKSPAAPGNYRVVTWQGLWSSLALTLRNLVNTTHATCVQLSRHSLTILSKVVRHTCHSQHNVSCAGQDSRKGSGKRKDDIPFPFGSGEVKANSRRSYTTGHRSVERVWYSQGSTLGRPSAVHQIANKLATVILLLYSVFIVLTAWNRLQWNSCSRKNLKCQLFTFACLRYRIGFPSDPESVLGPHWHCWRSQARFVTYIKEWVNFRIITRLYWALLSVLTDNYCLILGKSAMLNEEGLGVGLKRHNIRN